MTAAHCLAARLRLWLVPILLLLGLGLRSYHYLRDRAVWQDEAGLLLTVTARGYGDLFLGRLDYHQAAPPLYLWILKTVSLIFGDSSRALRLPSFAASCAALLLFVPLARSLLAPSATKWAVLFFAVSEQLLWHASEAKVYSFDVLAAVVVLAAAQFGRFASLWRRLAVYTLLAPMLLLSSYPACFLCLGVLFAYWPLLRDRNCLPARMAYTALALAIGTTLAWLLIGPACCQHDSEVHSCWIACMPSWRRPWTVPGWLLFAPFEVCRYAYKPLGQVLAFLVVPGALFLWRRGERTMVRLMAAPIVLALLAACLHRYPFGGVRVMAYTIPAILLFSAAAAPPALAWLNAHFRPASLVLTVLLLLPLLSSLNQIVHPWREADLTAVVDFVGEQRRGDDFILGNDVAQQYYFRRMGSAFHLLTGRPPLPSGERMWVVTTALLSRAERVRLASLWAPAGWQAQLQREFDCTTVILFARR